MGDMVVFCCFDERRTYLSVNWFRSYRYEVSNQVRFCYLDYLFSVSPTSSGSMPTWFSKPARARNQGGSSTKGGFPSFKPHATLSISVEGVVGQQFNKMNTDYNRAIC